MRVKRTRVREMYRLLGGDGSNRYVEVCLSGGYGDALPALQHCFALYMDGAVVVPYSVRCNPMLGKGELARMVVKAQDLRMSRLQVEEQLFRAFVWPTADESERGLAEEVAAELAAQELADPYLPLALLIYTLQDGVERVMFIYPRSSSGELLLSYLQRGVLAFIDR